MTDRELLELAARAFWGDEIDDTCSIRWSENDNAIIYMHGDNQDHNGRDVELCWNPLEWDHDALPLAVKLRLQVQINERSIVIYFNQSETGETKPELYEYPPMHQDADYNLTPVDHEAATRRAIVRAAAEIGKAMP